MISSGIMLLIFAMLAAAAFFIARQRAFASVGGAVAKLHSKPGYHAAYAALTALTPALILVLAWSAFGNTVVDGLVLRALPETVRPATPLEEHVFLDQVHNAHQGSIPAGNNPVLREAVKAYDGYKNAGANIVLALGVALACLGAARGILRVKPGFRSRNKVEAFLLYLLIGCSILAILTTIGIVLSLLFESLRFFDRVSIFEFLFGLHWSPQTAMRADQVGSSGAFGAAPLFLGTLLISFIAMCVAVPIGLMSAIYMTQYASPRFRKLAKPLLEILAGVPTVVYGFFAALTVAPALRDFGEMLGLTVASESALAAGGVMGIMIIPFMSSLSDDAITAVPQAMRDGSYALGATKSETIRNVLIPAALPGIVGAFLLSVSRAIGETMIVVMAAGLAANMTVNPLNAVTTVTVQIVALLTGDQEFDSAKTLSAFALGLMLFLSTLLLNVYALHIVRKYRETYE